MTSSIMRLMAISVCSLVPLDLSGLKPFWLQVETKSRGVIQVSVLMSFS